jgi:hypothetical protein
MTRGSHSLQRPCTPNVAATAVFRRQFWLITLLRSRRAACATFSTNAPRVNLIDAYRAGVAAASLAGVHGLSLRSVKRLVAAAGARRQPLTV